ncbi:uncharacterized protein JCM15063_004202 [Sporobolomyces koalae]|uniref:uncharacterized protein n=1 Tax=Sporobolomyces koalae TaxID=500713 RepID=UPI00316CF3B5
MLRLTAARRTATLAARAYATSAPATAPPPYPAVKSQLYDPDQEPALADLGYPKLSTDSRQLRSPRGWWDTQERIQFGEPVPENDDIQSMWAPDVHKVKPASALTQLLTMFGAIAVFSYGVYNIAAPAPALPRAYPHDGLVQALSGTNDEQYAARTDSANVVDEE